MTAMRCLLLLGALRAATALAPEAVEALLSIGDGERLSYLDFRESLHNEWSRNVSAPAVAAVRTACGMVVWALDVRRLLIMARR